MPSAKKVQFANVNDVDVDRTMRSPLNTDSKKLASLKKKSSNKRYFRNAAEAIESNQKKVRQDLTQQFLNIEPNLYTLALPKISVQAMEKMQNQLVNELDSLREVDPTTGDFSETKEFCDLEKKYLLLLEALDYFEQKKNLEALTQPQESDVCLKMKVDDTDATKHISCFSFLFQKHRLVSSHTNL